MYDNLFNLDCLFGALDNFNVVFSSFDDEIINGIVLKTVCCGYDPLIIQNGSSAEMLDPIVYILKGNYVRVTPEGSLATPDHPGRDVSV